MEELHGVKPFCTCMVIYKQLSCEPSMQYSQTEQQDQDSQKIVSKEKKNLKIPILNGIEQLECQNFGVNSQ